MKRRAARWALTTLLFAPSLAAAAAQISLHAAGSQGRRYNYLGEGVSMDIKSWQAPVSILARASGNQLFNRDNVLNPLNPGAPAGKRHSFARFQTGLRWAPRPFLSLEALGGRDAAGSRASTVEGQISWWPIFYSYHPVQLSVSSSYDDRTRIRSSSAGTSVGLWKVRGTPLFVSAFAHLYQGGLLRKAEGRIVGAFSASHPSGWGVRVGGGGGAHGAFVEYGLAYTLSL